jgi:hypothetical protein
MREFEMVRIAKGLKMKKRQQRKRKSLSLEQQHRMIFKKAAPFPRPATIPESGDWNLEQPYFGRFVDSRTTDAAYDAPAMAD